MTSEAQRIVIAEQLGWHHCHITAGVPCGIPPWVKSESDEYQQEVPRFTDDLNATNKAEKVFGDFGTVIWRTYQNHIAGGDVAVLAGKLCHATAAQRCEAFLRTIGKWEDDK